MDDKSANITEDMGDPNEDVIEPVGTDGEVDQEAEEINTERELFGTVGELSIPTEELDSKEENIEKQEAKPVVLSTQTAVLSTFLKFNKEPQHYFKLELGEEKKESAVTKEVSPPEKEKEASEGTEEGELRSNISNTQHSSSFGSEYPCTECAHSYWNIKSLRSHVRRTHGENTRPILFDCVYCYESFFTIEDRQKHEKEAHDEEIQEEQCEVKKARPSLMLKRKQDDYENAFLTSYEDEPTSTGKANVTLAVKCSVCPRSFSTLGGMISHRSQTHKDYKFAYTPIKKKKPYNSTEPEKVIESLPKDIISVKSDIYCRGCGEVFKTENNLEVHAETCNEFYEMYSNVEKHSEDGESFEFGFDRFENDPFEPPKAKRSLLVKESDEDANAKAIILFEKTSLTVEGVVKSRLPLTAAIFARAVQEPKELMVVWTQFLDIDLLDVVRICSSNAVICIKELDMINMSSKLTELLKNATIFTFNMLASVDTYNLWTFVSFEKEKPIGLENKMFKQFYEVEQILTGYSRNHGMTVNNMMREDGLFALLSQNLHGKISVFNSR